MSSPLVIAALAAGLGGLAVPAGDGGATGARVILAAGDCSEAARAVVDQTGGELLSAQPTGDGKCVVTVLVPGNGGRPKKVTMRVPM
ncbi:hypothetical protein [Ensifer soli]|uniref:hypothetical protein n=1 Tax=Ciceribacter sp. sgz301302 TaxID=3342379 RepID=UPI0035B988EB